MPNPSTIEEGAQVVVHNTNIEDQVPLDLPDTVEELTELQKNLPVIIGETKKGYKTTEFWVTVITSLAVVFNGIPAPESKEGYIVAFIAGLYAVARGLAKRGTPEVGPARDVLG